VIPGPQSDLLPGEVDAIQRWVQGGGNLLWLTDPGPHHGLDSLAAMLGVRFLPGTIVDPALGATGPGRATFVVATPGGYADHPVTHDFRQATLFPGTVALEAEPAHGWKARPLIRSSDRTWDETGPLTGTVRFDASRDRRGPLTIGLALTREHGAPDAGAGAAGRRQQRVAVIGDGDFLSNAYLGNGGNLDLGLSLINWLSRDDRLVAIPAKAAPDLAFTPSPAAPWIIGIGSLLVLPLLLLGAGLAIWLRRRAR